MTGDGAVNTKVSQACFIHQRRNERGQEIRDGRCVLEGCQVVAQSERITTFPQENWMWYRLDVWNGADLWCV